MINQGMNAHTALRCAQIRLMNLTSGDLQGIYDDLSSQGYEIPKEYSTLVLTQPSVKIFDHVFYWVPFITIGV